MCNGFLSNNQKPIDALICGIHSTKFSCMKNVNYQLISPIKHLHLIQMDYFTYLRSYVTWSSNDSKIQVKINFNF